MSDMDLMDYQKEYEEYLREKEPLYFGFKNYSSEIQGSGTIDGYLMLLIKGYINAGTRSDLDKHIMDVLEDEWFWQWPLVRWAYASRLLYGIGCRKKVKKAVELLLPLCQKGYPGAVFDIGCCYMNGWGMEKSYAKAIDCWTKASIGGYEKAQEQLLLEFYTGEHGDYKDLPLRVRVDYLNEAVRMVLKSHNATIDTICDKLSNKQRQQLARACREILRSENKLPKQTYLRDAASLFWDDDENPYKIDV